MQRTRGAVPRTLYGEIDRDTDSAGAALHAEPAAGALVDVNRVFVAQEAVA